VNKDVCVKRVSFNRHQPSAIASAAASPAHDAATCRQERVFTDAAVLLSIGNAHALLTTADRLQLTW